MADNIQISAGSGTTVATDDVSGTHFQRVKLVDGTLDSTAAIAGDATYGLDVDVTRVGGNVSVIQTTRNTLIVDAHIQQATTDVGAANPLQVTLANGSVPAHGVTDNAGSLTVDAPVGTPVFVRLSDGSAALTGQKAMTASLPVVIASDQSALSVASHAVTNAGTFATQVDGAALTALQLIDDPVATTASAIPSKGMAISGTDGTNARIIKTDTSGELQVDILSIAAGSNAIGKLAANSGVTIGAVEIAATQTLATLTTLTGGGVAHDGADSGNPVKVGSKSVTALTTNAAVASGDRADLTSDLDGAIITHQTPHGGIIQERVSDTGGTSTVFTNFGAGGAGVYNYITTLSVYNSSATAGYVDIRDGSAGTVLFTMPAPAGGGSVLSFPVPLRSSANTAFAYDVSGALSTVYISAVGYRSKS